MSANEVTLEIFVRGGELSVLSHLMKESNYFLVLISDIWCRESQLLTRSLLAMKVILLCWLSKFVHFFKLECNLTLLLPKVSFIQLISITF